MNRLLLIASLALMMAACSKEQPIPEYLLEDEGVEINGTTWATRNVGKPGQFTEHPYDVGGLYCWNDKTAWFATYPITSYPKNAEWSYGEVSTSVIWKEKNDPCPTGWRIPYESEFEELRKSDFNYGLWNDISGVYFVDLFIPENGVIEPQFHFSYTLGFTLWTQDKSICGSDTYWSNGNVICEIKITKTSFNLNGAFAIRCVKN